MKTIPKKYLSAKFVREARSLVRSWSQKGESDEALVQEIIEAYGAAKNRNRFHLGALLAMVFDLKCPDAAKKCAKLFNIPLADGCSVSESIYATGISDEVLTPWRKDFSPKVMMWHPIVEELNIDKYPLVVYPSMADRVLTIHQSDAIYVYRRTDGALNLFLLHPSAENILIDEEQFADEAPLYFTEKTHFVSPIFKLRLVMLLLDFVLGEVGYPPLKIDLTAVFISPQAYLLNYDCYAPGGDNVADWEGATVIMRRDHLNEYLFTDVSRILVEGDFGEFAENEINSKLLGAFAAVSILYGNIDFHDEMGKYDSVYLKSLCKKYAIFSS